MIDRDFLLCRMLADFMLVADDKISTVRAAQLLGIPREDVEEQEATNPTGLRGRIACRELVPFVDGFLSELQTMGRNREN